MYRKRYIDNFCDDLNYSNAILYIGNVHVGRLVAILKEHGVNKVDGLDFRQAYIYIENCDLHTQSWPIEVYLQDGYNVYVLHEEYDGRYYIEVDL